MAGLKNTKPSIRFPEFNDSWKHVQLNQLLYESKKRNEDLKFNKEQVLSVSREFGIVNQIQHLGRSYAGASVHNYHVVEPGDIVYTKSPLKETPYGIIKINKGVAGIVSTLYAVYKVNKQLADGDFIDTYFSLDANTNRYLRPLVKKGAKNDMKVNNAYVLNDKIFVPDKKEQERIAGFFEILDQRLQMLKSRLDLLRQYKNCMMENLFTEGSSKRKFPKWTQKKLGDITIKTGRKNKDNIKYPIYSINNKEGFRPQGEQFEGRDSNKRGFDISMYKIIDKKTFAYNPARINVGSIGYSGELQDIIVSSLYVCFQTNEEVDDSFLRQFFDTPQFKRAVLTRVEGGVREYLFYENFSSIDISLPSLEEQRWIAKPLIAMDSLIENAEKEVQQTELYKKGLIQNMFC